MDAIAYIGNLRTTEVPVTITEADIILGLAFVPCFECDGTGWWDYAPYAVPGADCVDCKGLGKVTINC